MYLTSTMVYRGLLFVALMAVFNQVNGFIVPQNANRLQATSLSAEFSRRTFAAASAGAAISALLSGIPAFAIDDLAMPTGKDAEAQAVSFW